MTEPSDGPGPAEQGTFATKSRVDRPFQRRLLEKLYEAYPRQLQLGELGLDMQQKDPHLVFNAKYLGEHGLIEANVLEPYSGSPMFVAACITAKGIDFLEDDGGLSAVLNVVTVRFEAETLKALLAARVDASDLPPEQKSKLKAKLQALGEDALKEVTKRLLSAALDHVPTAFQMLQSLAA